MSNLNELSDAELSAVFAVEVAGWAINCRNTACWVPKENVNAIVTMASCFIGEEKFATSMDAVLPYLEKHDYFIDKDMVVISGEAGADYDNYFTSRGSSVSRNACIALILAARADKEDGK